MSNLVRLVDFQICVGPAGLTMEQQRSVNVALFATYEPIRQWLKEHAVKAPFRKLVVTLADQSVFAKWHGMTSVAVRICEVTEAADLATLQHDVEDHRWVIAVTQHALSSVARDIGWRCAGLDTAIGHLARMDFPLVHPLKGLFIHDDKRDLHCEPWLATRPGLTEIGAHVRVGDHSEDIVVRSAEGPLYLEDDFPITKLELSSRTILWLDKRGKTLATTTLSTSHLG